MSSNNPDPLSPNPPGSSLAAVKAGLALVVAGIFVAGFVALIAYLSLTASSSSELVWQRRVYVFGGLEAVVFAAVGWLFGREVHRQQAEQAETRADKAETTARQDNARAADLQARGLALKAAIRTRATATSDAGGVRSRGIADQGTNATSADLQDLADFASQVFPD